MPSGGSISRDEGRQRTETGPARSKGVGRICGSAPKPKAVIVLAVLGWLVAAGASYILWGTVSEVRFRAAIAPGHSEREVRLGVGSPDAIAEDQKMLRSGRLDSYLVSTRPVDKSVFVYYRFGHAVLVYMNKDGFVDNVYWARRK